MEEKIKKMEKSGKIRLLSGARLLLCAALAAAALCGCSASPGGAKGPEPSGGQTASTGAEPVKLEQYLLKNRGIAYDQSDYPKLVGGEGIIDLTSEFDCNVDHSYSTDINDIVVSGGKLYLANLNTPSFNGQSLWQAGVLPGSDVVSWHMTYDGEMGSLYLKGGAGYKVSARPFSALPLDSAQSTLFAKVYRYAADGKTLEDHTAEFLNAHKVYTNGGPTIVFIGEQVYLLFPAQYLDPDTTGWNWYRDMGWREYIAFDLDLSAIGGETPIRLFNCNILTTDRAFYELYYASEPLDDSDAEAQLAPDGSVSPYFPSATHPNCPMALRRITLLTDFYTDIRCISAGSVITDDYTILPIKDIITEGYGDYDSYSPVSFGTIR